MMKRIVALAIGLGVMSAAGAVNDPDSIDRSVKYLDSMSSVIVSYYTPNSQCLQVSPNPPSPVPPITCVALTGVGYEPMPVTSVGDIAVAAYESHSLLSLNMHPVVDYALTNVSPSTSTLILNAVVKVSVESSVLSDPTLINPRTGQPFNGKIETNYQWIFDQRPMSSNLGFGAATKMPFEATILSRKTLTSVYGLSSTRAASVFARPITVRVSVTGNFLGSGRANFYMSGRLLGD